VCLIADAARIRSRPSRSVVDVCNSAKHMVRSMGAATNVDDIARAMESRGLLMRHGERYDVSERLTVTEGLVDRKALLATAVVLLELLRPPWLALAVSADGTVRIDRIPLDAIDALIWLGDELHGVLSAAYMGATREQRSVLRTELGDFGETVVVENERMLGRIAFRVSTLSDAFGYDVVSSTPGGTTKHIEVKAALSSTKSRIHVSRHELETGKLQRDIWQLVQVVFDAASFWSSPEARNTAEVVEFRCLRVTTWLRFAPVDTANASWHDRALFELPDHVWEPYPIGLAPSARRHMSG